MYRTSCAQRPSWGGPGTIATSTCGWVAEVCFRLLRIHATGGYAVVRTGRSAYCRSVAFLLTVQHDRILRNAYSHKHSYLDVAISKHAATICIRAPPPLLRLTLFSQT